MKILTKSEFFKLSDKEKPNYIFFSEEYEFGLDVKVWNKKYTCEDCGKDFNKVYGTSDMHEPKFCLKCFKKQIYQATTNPLFLHKKGYYKDIEHKDLISNKKPV